ncbi:RimK domain-containing protein ATP-grasp [Thalassospira profundimaris]|uniref:RimK domain-containing protein ATP-grasp n=1 Tax=Thalassospira profundimaris TaxID=502049 RepID=UPI00028735C1|nr:RimK domain-containing protein ATP-grasp [Thalassospira profundimaris]EKF07341.1 RimK domain-containing protein ATP-grasp [Thalassospira profundimaris WP0211]
MLLILTSRNDLAVDYLILSLIEKKLPYFRINTEDLCRAEGGFSVGDFGVYREISIGSRKLDLSKVISVIYRRALHPNPSTDLSISERRFVAGEIRHFMMGLILDPNVKWVNSIDKVSVAENKIYQLRVASSLGIPVPRTIVSNKFEELTSFINTNPSGTVCKPIYHGFYQDESGDNSIYTRAVSEKDLLRANLEVCPVLLQENLAGNEELRVTVVGDKIFTARVLTEDSLVDWRRPEANSRFERASLTKKEEQLCIDFLGYMGLSYGAFDFIRTRDGRLCFLEVNPAGEWAWLEDQLGFEIRDALIELCYGAGACHA